MSLIYSALNEMCTICTNTVKSNDILGSNIVNMGMDIYTYFLRKIEYNAFEIFASMKRGNDAISQNFWAKSYQVKIQDLPTFHYFCVYL